MWATFVLLPCSMVGDFVLLPCSVVGDVYYIYTGIVETKADDYGENLAISILTLINLLFSSSFLSLLSLAVFLLPFFLSFSPSFFPLFLQTIDSI